MTATIGPIRFQRLWRSLTRKERQRVRKAMWRGGLMKRVHFGPIEMLSILALSGMPLAAAWIRLGDVPAADFSRTDGLFFSTMLVIWVGLLHSAVPIIWRRSILQSLPALGIPVCPTCMERFTSRDENGACPQCKSSIEAPDATLLAPLHDHVISARALLHSYPPIIRKVIMRRARRVNTGRAKLALIRVIVPLLLVPATFLSIFAFTTTGQWLLLGPTGMFLIWTPIVLYFIFERHIHPWLLAPQVLQAIAMTDTSHCHCCGYDLTGLPPDATCPECQTRRLQTSPVAYFDGAELDATRTIMSQRLVLLTAEQWRSLRTLLRADAKITRRLRLSLILSALIPALFVGALVYILRDYRLWPLVLTIGAIFTILSVIKWRTEFLPWSLNRHRPTLTDALRTVLNQSCPRCDAMVDYHTRTTPCPVCAYPAPSHNDTQEPPERA